MRIISRKVLREFWKNNPEAEEPLAAWFRLASLTRFANFSEVKRAFGTADYVSPYTVFDIGGNKFRLVVAIHFNRERIYVRHVFTHAEYDKWTVKLRKHRQKK